MSSTLSSFISSFFPTSYAETEEKPAQEEGEAQAEEAEEEEPEDILPELREECKAAPTCAGFDKHFQHCTEKVTNGEGFKGEDCVEELFHLMHCVDNCVAPKLFSKLR